MASKIDKYKKFFNGEFLMGPNSIYLLDEILTKYPLELKRSDAILDLGCGKGLTSLFLAKETKALVYANDLRISEEENKKRFEEWNVSKRIIPSCEDAAKLSFENEKFSAIVSIDAYHYFGGKKIFLSEKIMPFLKSDGRILIAVPGIKSEYNGRQETLLREWLGDEAYMFRSIEDWKKIIGSSYEVEKADIWEMENFSLAWDSWLKAENEFADGDRAKFDTIINKYTCFLGIVITKR